MTGLSVVLLRGLKACYERRRVRDRVKIVETDIEDLKFGKEAAQEKCTVGKWRRHEVLIPNSNDNT